MPVKFKMKINDFLWHFKMALRFMVANRDIQQGVLTREIQMVLLMVDMKEGYFLEVILSRKTPLSLPK